MAIIAKASSGQGESFAPAPMGLHRAICCDVVDLGMVEGQYGTKHKVRIVWQTESLMPDGRPYMVDQRYTLSLDERANLRRDLELWRGKPFTMTEAAGFDLERLIGVPCALMIVHKPKTKRPGEVFANIQAVLPVTPGAPLTIRGDYVRVCLRQHQAPHPVGPSHAPAPTGYQPPAQTTGYQPPQPTTQHAPLPVIQQHADEFDNDPFGESHSPAPMLTDADIPF